MKIRHSEVEIGDVLLMAKGSQLCCIKVIGITKAGSLKYTFKGKEDWKDDESFLQEDFTKHDKTRYFQKYSAYDDYFWLLHRNTK